MRSSSPRLVAAVVLALAALALVVLVPPAARTHVSDDSVFLVPIVVSDLEGRSFWSAVRTLLAPDRAYLPRAGWRLYVLASLGLLGPSNAGLIYGGLALHMASSWLVWTLARRLGMGPRAAWLAAGLHFTAWAGSHAWIWPVAVQHVISSLGVLAVLNLYLGAEQRRRAGRPWRALYWATGAVALVSSLSRASSLIGPAAILVHVLLHPGDARERLRRYDVWWPVVMLSALYPLALLTWAIDAETLGALPTMANLTRRLVWRLGPLPVLAGVIAYVAMLLLLGRSVLALWARSPLSSGVRLSDRWRLGLWAVAILAGGPWLLRIAAVFVWGVEAFLSPLGMALNSHNTNRWHMTALPVDAAGIGLAAGAAIAFLARYGRRGDPLLLGVVLLGFGHAVYASDARPLRYWIYITPVLSIVLAAALDAAAAWLAGDSPRGARRQGAALAAVGAVIILSNVAAIRLELWRHKAADAYMTLDYARAADLIRLDLARAEAPRNAPVCVNGLEPPPNQLEWETRVGQRARPREHNIRSILAQALGRRDVASLGLDCEPTLRRGSYAYLVRGGRVLRDGQPVDPFEILHVRLRERVGAGDYRGAIALARDRSAARPFVLRFLLEERLPDDDLLWATNGASVLAWLDRTAASHDNWYWRRDPKIEALRSMARKEIADYVRFLFLVQYAYSRVPAPGPAWEAAGQRLPFGGIPLDEVAAIVREDAFLSSQPEMGALLEGIVASSSYSGPARTLGQPRSLTTLPLFTFLGRLILNDVGL